MDDASKKKKKKKERCSDRERVSAQANAASPYEVTSNVTTSVLRVTICDDPREPGGYLIGANLRVNPKTLKRWSLPAGVRVMVITPNRRTVASLSSDDSIKDQERVYGSNILSNLNASSPLEAEIQFIDDVPLLCKSLHVVVESKLYDLAKTKFSGLDLPAFIKACFQDGLFFREDRRQLTVYGKQYWLDIVDVEGGDGEGPWEVSKETRIFLRPKGRIKKAPQAGFRRIGGLKNVVEELKTLVQMPLEKPDAYRKLGLSPPKGVLLYGPPGTGKTLLALSLSEQLGCNIEILQASDMMSKFVGETEERIKELFEKCRALDVPSLIFIDEIDALCPKREDSGESERRVVATFLTALDGADKDSSKQSIVVLGATNRPNDIDLALRRAGRFEREIEVGVPSVVDRQEIFEIHLENVPHDLMPEDIHAIAKKCHGYVGADCGALCRTASLMALDDKCATVKMSHFEGAMHRVRPSALKEMCVEAPEVHWSDIGGYENTKNLLRQCVEWPFKYAWAFRQMDVAPPKGVLLYGPPGCSKTMMAKAVATESEMNFISIKGPELFSKYVGESEKAVRDLFRRARQAAPCVIFFDEVDAIGSNRDADSGVGSRVLTTLLNEMDGISSTLNNKHLVVMAATNRPNVLDPALMRPGRLDRHILISLPDEEARKQILTTQLFKMGVTDVEWLVHGTKGYSGAETVMVCKEAAMLAIQEALQRGTDNVELNRAHLEHSLKRVLPQITEESVAFFEDFRSRHQN